MGNPKIHLQNHLSCFLGFLLLFLFTSNAHPISSSPSTTNPNATLNSSFLCHTRQSHALLQFKSNFVMEPPSLDRRYDYYHPKTESWKESTDCCSSWDGVTCDGESGRVTGLDLSSSHLQGSIHSNSSLFNSDIAPYLQMFSLASNNFQGSNMSSLFGVKFGSSLTHLDLSYSMFSGNIPSEIFHLSNLVSLDLSYNYGLGPESDEVLESIAQNLTQLRVLSLDGLNMSSIHASTLMNLSSSLTSLSLRACELQGQFPASFLLRPNLQELDLSRNNFRFITSLPYLNSTTTPYSNLTFLSLDQTDLSTSIGFLDFVGNRLKSLRHLYLRGCNISGSLPPSLGNLIHLTGLALGGTRLSGPIPPSLGNLTNLVFLHLYLGGNRSNGLIPTSFSNLIHLTDLNMSNSGLDGPLPSYLFALPSLEHIDLSYNNLHGQIPTSPIKSMNLINLDLSNNNLGGIQDFAVFLNLTKLEYLDLSNNNISSSISIDTNLSYSLPSLLGLDLSGCNLNEFPTFIKALKNLTRLDVSNNKIQGPVPEWIYDVGKDTLISIDISGNLLTSVGHQLNWTNIMFVEFQSNLLQGPLPIPPPTTLIFSVANNILSGEISSLICNLSKPVVLDFSHNQFIGLIPQCLGSMNTLSMLNLGMNSLHGPIPNTFANHSGLSSLVLKGNQLMGTIPQTLSYCRNLQILDVGNNLIEDTVPHWLETLSRLEVLVLRSNKFYGSLDSFEDTLVFPALRILDLSNNNFVGRFPIKLIKNLNAMTEIEGKLEDDMQYMTSRLKEYYSMTIVVKGFEMEYVRILIKLVTIDLSRNKFEGHIPEVIAKLISLKGLNLSHNLLTGHIPSLTGDLGSLEWLDLSHNELSGQIPKELADLNFLEVLNLSSNQLHGAIPQGKQFNTFGNDSYKDNLALCGFPLTKACGPNHEPPSNTDEDTISSDSEGGFSWEGAFVGYGCGIVFGLSMGYLVFTARSPKWFMKIVEGKQRGVGKRSKRRARTRN